MITVLAWQPHTREPERPGRQGQDLIPKKGDTGTFYLTGGGQKPLEMVTPNGVVVDKTKKPVATPAINLWVDLGLGLISEADAKAKMEPADADFKTTLDSELKELNGDLHGVRQVTGKQFSDILAKMDQVSSFSSTSVIGMTKEHGYLEVKFFLASNRSYVAIVCAPLGDFPAATHNKLRELLDIKTKDESKK